ncbi:hypothetical protein IAQ61_006787 [Plenodomus lingam]|uniref:uncharacterized protein n=1 Tax=Leptosphaeria maculans TaxID=5022 RepID=UPI00331FBD81|nr:hypothetical protein IAQ61_006787 [Plenodomus lingam]
MGMGCWALERESTRRQTSKAQAGTRSTLSLQLQAEARLARAWPKEQSFKTNRNEAASDDP